MSPEMKLDSVVFIYVFFNNICGIISMQSLNSVQVKIRTEF